MKEGVSKKSQPKNKVNPKSKHIQKKDKKPFNKPGKKFTAQRKEKIANKNKNAEQVEHVEQEATSVPVSRIEALYQKGKKLYEEVTQFSKTCESKDCRKKNKSTTSLEAEVTVC